MRRKIVAALLVLVLLLGGCGFHTKKYETGWDGLFDTYISFTAYTTSQSEFITYCEIVYSELERLHKLFDIYHDYDGTNNLKTVNDSAGIAPVEVDGEIIRLLELSQEAYDYTSGAVNAALGPVLRLWHSCREQGDGIPSQAELRAAAEYTSMERVIIDRELSTVYLPEAGMSLDVGAVAKGYAAQAAATKAQAMGLRSALLNAGGNVVSLGSPMDGREAWSVGVQSPFDTGQILYVVRASNIAAVTSGDYQRVYETDGIRYHHIIDPGTLFPAKNARAVTVLHPDSAIADILSTAAFILPYEQAHALVEKMGAEALWITDEGELMTDGFAEMSYRRE